MSCNLVHQPLRKRIYSTVSGEWSFLEAEAEAAGFIAVGVMPAGRISSESAAVLGRWLDAGFHGELSFMERTRPQREDLRHPGISPNAGAIVVAALPYGDGAFSGGLWSSVARHARGIDYHRTVKEKLALLADAVRARFPGAVCRLFCDTAPVAERSWAASAGIGCLGKSGALMVAGYGPCAVLGEVVCAGVPEVVTVAAPKPAFADCGNCTACMDACPTGALVSPGVVDCRRCLSYWSIERKQLPLPDFYSESCRWVFGCDICTAVCPETVGTACGLDTGELGKRTEGIELRDILQLSDRTLDEKFKESAMLRTGWKNLRENARLLLERDGRKRK